MAPVVDRLKNEYQGVVEFRLINVETDAEGAQLASDFGVQFVPSFVLLGSDGAQRDLLVGEMTEEQLRAAIDALE
ncbi:MAG: thioredoxin family protein [Coriobacteriia bacterium]|nr:thioredoxin family protein [Coriobacteriia bacterium]